MSLFCGKRCQNRKDKRLENKTDVKLARIEGKTDRVQVRQDGKTSRTEVRQEEKSVRSGQKVEAQMVAFENGIDPNASKWQGISSLGSSVAGAAASILGGPGSVLSAGGGSVFGANDQNRAAEKSSFPWWILLLAIPLLMGKKR